MHPFLEGLRPTLHISHRGGALVAPENTLAAFREAVVRHRTDMLELDVHATRDGAIVVHHDDDLGRCTDATGAIASMSLDEVLRADAGYHFTQDDGKTFPYRGSGLRIPLLSEVLAAFLGVRFNLEVKAQA